VSRLLVIAPAAVHGSALRREIERRSRNGAEVRLVVPAVTESKVRHAFGDVDDAIADAKSRLSRSVEGLRGNGISVSATVGDSDPMVAAEDALGSFAADEVLIITHPAEQADWYERGLFEQAAERFEPPVAHIELDAGYGRRQLAEVERAGPGAAGDEPGADEVALSPNLPPFSKRDLAGIAVAIAGTVVLAILAADPPGGTDSFGGAARILIAIAFSLVNLAHVVGLVFFNSQRYRGAGPQLFARLSLFGTPLAIVVSLLIG
jgi:hypothetical protein